MEIEVGFYGKLPSHGDFLRRRVSDRFVGVWDSWLQESLAASRATLGDGWLDIYLTSPAWRFALAAGLCGAGPAIGLIAPSVDRVGRYFPLTIVAELPTGTPNLLTVACGSDLFYDGVEQLVIETLEGDHVDVDRFDEQLKQLTERFDVARLAPRVVLEDAAALIDDPAGGWHLPIGSVAELRPALDQVFEQRLSDVYAPMALWWTEGSAKVQPSCLVVRGLPHPDSFAALLEGSWSERRWRSISARVEVSHTPEPLVPPGAAPTFRSAAASNVGCVREINEDSFIERCDAGIWGVADGLGGHSSGEVASRMVCDALADVAADGTFEDLIEAVRRRVGDVNDQLVRAATRPMNAVSSGSTVVTLLARGSSCAVLWAGDSRVYLWRDGSLEQLTRDHSVAELEGPDAPESHAITRAVGGEPALELDLVRHQVHPGDRFLLCSDGLSRIVPKVELAGWMAHEDIAEAVDGLVKATLAAGAPDNVTALVVEALPLSKSAHPARADGGGGGHTLSFGV